jgi:Arc/MetJ-type ribon-helix-helix transcriptional regulator
VAILLIGYAQEKLIMAIPIPADVEASLRQFVERGQYDDPESALREAVHLLETQERRREELRQKIRVGIEQVERGDVIEWSEELRAEIKASAIARAARGETPDPDVCQ